MQLDPAWINAFANLGAVGVLGWFLTMTLPGVIRQFDDTHTSMIKSILADQVSERQAFGQRADRLSNSIDRLSDSFRDYTQTEKRKRTADL